MKRVLLALALLVLPALASAQSLGDPQTINTQDSGTACANNGTCAVFTVQATLGFTYSVTGTLGTLTAECLTDPIGGWTSMLLTKVDTAVQATTITATGKYNAPTSGCQQIRLRATSWTPGQSAVITAVRGYGNLAQATGSSSTPTFSRLFLADGTQGLPSLTFTNANTSGFYRAGSNDIRLVLAGTNDEQRWFANGVTFRSDSQIQFSSTTNLGAAADTGITRGAAGQLNVGNGSASDFSGTVKATNYITAGTGLAVANVGANSCGTTAATIAGGNNAFAITVGATSGTQCRITFTFAAATEWDCAFNDQTTTIAIRSTPVDTSHTDALGAFTAGDKVTGICFPR